MSRFRIIMFLVALVALRLVIGFHFFAEGATKLKSGNFTAEPFLRAATGPFQSYFHGLLDDPWGARRLGVTVTAQNGNAHVEIDPSLTLALWDDFVDQAEQYYHFGDRDWAGGQAQTIGQTQTVALDPKVGRTPTASNPEGHSVAKVSNNLGSRVDRADSRETLENVVRDQPQRAKEIYESHKQDYLSWLAANRTEIIEFFGTAQRTEGFKRDGEHWRETALEVDSLRSQRDAILTARNQKARGWKAEIDALWDSFESQINGLAVDKQTALKPLKVHRPFQQEQSRLQWVNRIVPWFDLTVGICLVIGLFTRSAALLGAGFLASVILSQPPWVPGAASTQYQIVELAAMLLLAVSVAGQIAGLDFFWSSRARDRRVLE